MPVDFSADVPIFPPFSMMLTMITGRIIWKVTGQRLSFHNVKMPVRIAVLAIGFAMAKFAVLDNAGGSLAEAGSGTLFTPVGGLATTGLYEYTRNPMYVSLIFMALPMLSFVVNSAWPILLSPITWSYLTFVVIAAEEALLTAEFGAEYTAYQAKVPRWLI